MARVVQVEQGLARTPGVVRTPSLCHEGSLWRSGYRVVAGVDEVGRGAWAGPVSVGIAVVSPGRRRLPKGLRDSKLLTEDAREQMFEPLGAWCTAWAVGHAWPQECDALGMTAALRLALHRAASALPCPELPDAVVLDGSFDYVSPPSQPTLFSSVNRAEATSGPTSAYKSEAGKTRTLVEESADPSIGGTWSPEVRTVVRGDATCASVAAASVLAKVTRDRLMRADAESYPPFDFDRNKGYPSPAHQTALRGYGLTAVHRRSWSYAGNLPWSWHSGQPNPS